MTSAAWALVLAGGEGRRLRHLTRRITGDERPKQFCRVLDDVTLLEQTLRRSALLVPREHTLAVVVDAHARFYAPLLSGVPALGLAIQPENRGTAPAVLYGLLHVMAAAPESPVVIVPSDHYVSNDAAFMAHVETATEAVVERPDLVILLGVMPDSTDVEDGWVEPGERIAGPWRSQLHRARHCWEKPSPRLAVSLRRARRTSPSSASTASGGVTSARRRTSSPPSPAAAAFPYGPGIVSPGLCAEPPHRSDRRRRRWPC